MNTTFPGFPRETLAFLSELRDHQPLIVLVSISLVVAAFAPSGLSRDLAVGAFGTFLFALFISILIRIAPEGRMSGFALYFFLYLFVGFAALFAAGYFLVSESSVASNLRGLPPLALLLSFLSADYFRGWKWAKAIQPRRLRIVIFQYLCGLGVFFIAYVVVWTVLVLGEVPRPAGTFGSFISLLTLIAFFAGLPPVLVVPLLGSVKVRIRSWLAAEHSA